MLFKEPPSDFHKEVDVVGCFLEHNGTFLLLHRHTHKSSGDAWGLPAGKVDAGESLLSAMKREVYEETGIDIRVEDLTYFDSRFVRHENSDFVWHMFSTPLKEKPSVILSATEHKDYRWVTPKEAVEMNLIFGLEESIHLFYGTSDTVP